MDQDYVKRLENVAASARWLRSIEKRYAEASFSDQIDVMVILGVQVREAKVALDHALQQSST